MNYIGINGWVYISKKKLSYENYISIRSKLMNISPFTANSKYTPKVINLFKENKTHMILPRIYGLYVINKFKLKFDYFKDNYLTDGKSMNNKYISKVIPYDYQVVALDNIYQKYKKGALGGILKLPTGSGKTITSIILAQKINKKCLIITKTKKMSDQWEEDILKCFPNATISIISSYKNNKKGIEDIKTCDFIICIRNSLYRNPSKYNNKDFEDIGFVLIDEVHTYSSEKVLNIFNHISRRFILGVTATLKRIDNLDYLLKYYIGSTIHEFVKSYSGVLPKIHFINFNAKDPKRKQIIKFKKGFNTGEVNFFATYKCILTDDYLIESIVNLLNKCASDNYYKRIVVLAQYRFILEKIHEKIGKELSGLFYSVTSRKDIEEMKNTIKNKKIILAVSALGRESLNIVDCNCLIMLTAPIIKKDMNNTWNTTNLTQAIGRCLRQNWKNAPHIYIYNYMFSFFYRHMKLRQTFFQDLYNSDIHILDQETLKLNSEIKSFIYEYKIEI